MINQVVYDEVFDAQRDFRVIIDSMSRPGKINQLSLSDIYLPPGLSNGSALIGLALLNSDVSFHSSGKHQEEIVEYIAINTGSRFVALTVADFIFISGLHDESIITKVKTGSLPYPEESATIVIDVSEISEMAIECSVHLTLKGPGVKTEKDIYITGINQGILELTKEQNSEFPLGIDLMLTDNNGRLVCIPRSNQFVINNN